jgi:carnitine O-palmitoyltransferase 2
LSQDGKAAVNFEHSWGDGVAVMRFFNEVHGDSTKKARIHPGQATSGGKIDPCKHVRRLEFQLNDALKLAVDQARRRFDEMTGQLAVDVFLYEGFSKSFCKQQKVSPDAIMQLGFQVRQRIRE